MAHSAIALSENNKSQTQVLEALYVLYNDPDNNNRRSADKWLREFRNTSEAWEISDALLMTSTVPDYAHFFAAQTLQTKIRFDFHQQLPSNCWNSLRESILAHVLRFQNGSKLTRMRLSLAVAALVVQDDTWSTPINHLVNCFGSSSPQCLLEILSVLPEEIDSPHGNNEQRHRLLTDELQNSAVDILNMLVSMMHIASSPSRNVSMQKSIFSCFMNWIQYCPIPPGIVASNPLFIALFDALVDEDIFEEATDAILCILRIYDHVEKDIPIIQLIVPRIMSLKSLLLNSIAQENDETFRGLCRIFTEMAESYLELIIGEQDINQIDILELLLHCTSYPDPEIAKITLNFWYRFTGKLCQLQKNSPHAIHRFQTTLTHLAQTCMKVLQLPQDFEEWLLDQQEDFSAYRQDVGDNLRDCCELLGASKVLEKSLEGLKKYHGVGDWRAIEAYLYSIRAVAREVNESENEFLPQIFRALPQLPDHPAIQYTSNLIISRYGRWLNRHVELLPSIFGYTVKGFQCSKDPSFNVSSASAIAVNSLCFNCAGHVGENVFTVYEQLDHVEVKDQLLLLEGVCHVISHVPLSDIPNYANRVLSPIVHRLNSAVQSRTTNLEAINDDLKRLATIFSSLRPQEIPSDQIHPIVAIFNELWPLFSQILAAYGGNSKIAESLCRCFKYAIRSCRLHFGPILERLVSLIIQSFSAFSQSSYLYCASIVVSEFGTQTEYNGVLMTMINELSKHLMTLLTNMEAFIANPNIVEEYFYLIERSLKYSPEIIVHLNLLSAILQCGNVGLKTQHSEANKRILYCFEQMIQIATSRNNTNPSWQNPSVQQGIKQGLLAEGCNLVHTLFEGVLGKLLLSRIDSERGSLTSVLMHLAEFDPAALQEWISVVLDQLLSPQQLNQSQKMDFIQNLLTAQDETMFQSVLHEFGRKYRN